MIIKTLQATIVIALAVFAAVLNHTTLIVG